MNIAYTIDFSCHFSQTVPALVFPWRKEHLILWVLSKSKSEIPLTLLPGGSSKVQQGSGLWVATKPSLIFRHIKAWKWIQLQTSRCQPPKLAKYFAVAKLQSCWAVWGYLPVLKCWRIRSDCLTSCSPCNQPEVGLAGGKCWESHSPPQGKVEKCAFSFRAQATLCCAHPLSLCGLQGWDRVERPFWYGNN